MVRLSLVGAEALQKAMRQAPGRVIEAVGAGLYGAGNNVMADSKRRVPVRYGTLKGSGYVTMPETSGTTVTVEMGYGGPAEAYAIVQHERLDFHHPEGGEAKYLERAVNAARPAIPREVAEIARRALARGQGPTLNPAMPTDPWSGKPER